MIDAPSRRSGIQPSSTDQPHLPAVLRRLINTIEKNREASETLMTATTNFQVANDKFTTGLSGTARQGDKGASTMTISTDDFEAYKNTVVELIAAAKTLQGNSALVSSSTKTTFRRAIETFELSWTNFVSGKDGQINGDGLLPFLKTAGEFLKAPTEFFQAISAATTTKSKKVSAPEEMQRIDLKENREC
jgi:hypothetical protein